MTPLDCHLELVTMEVVDTSTALKKGCVYTSGTRRAISNIKYQELDM